jgi:lysozyme family protein
MFILAYFMLFLWSITSLLYALIKQHEVGINTFTVLTPYLWITVHSYMIDPFNIYYILIGIL